jgi:hypothetical protein
MSRLRVVAAVTLGGLFLTACSQVSSLTPVGGAALTSVRNATYDVLVDQQISVLVAPQCASTESGFTCTGSTIDAEDIVAEAGGEAPYQLTITIGGRVIFEGTAQEVLEAAVLESS